MSSDAVNSISDTVESDQVAKVVKATYFKIIANKDWPHLKGTLTLNAVASAARPTHFTLPESVQKIEEILYDKAEATDTTVKYSPVYWRSNTDFLEIVHARASDADNVLSVPDFVDNVELLVITDHSPTYWTSFDDEHIVMDSYDEGVDSTLQGSKLICTGWREPAWEWSDTFVPDLPSKLFPYLLAEAKSTCFATVKQMPNPKEEQWSMRLKSKASQDKHRQDGKMKFASYGRK